MALSPTTIQETQQHLLAARENLVRSSDNLPHGERSVSKIFWEARDKAMKALEDAINSFPALAAAPERAARFITKLWACPVCSFPENFLPDCSLCGTHYDLAEPEE